MADYHPLIARAVAGLDKNTGENRRALYERARTALVAQLRGVMPALDESEITRERLALEEAIRKVEAEAARQAREAARADLVGGGRPPARTMGARRATQPIRPSTYRSPRPVITCGDQYAQRQPPHRLPDPLGESSRTMADEAWRELRDGFRRRRRRPRRRAGPPPAPAGRPDRPWGRANRPGRPASRPSAAPRRASPPATGRPPPPLPHVVEAAGDDDGNNHDPEERAH